MLVPGGEDDVRPVGGEDGCGVGQIRIGEMLLEGNRGVVIQEQWTEGRVAEEDV